MRYGAQGFGGPVNGRLDAVFGAKVAQIPEPDFGLGKESISRGESGRGFHPGPQW
jgi:hypothetical protein